MPELSGVGMRDGQRVYYIARPMAVGDRKCLDCHTTPEAAPPKQVEIYGSTGGYGWNMGDIVAAQVVYVPVSEAFRSSPRDLKMGVGALGGALALITLVGVVVLRRA